MAVLHKAGVAPPFITQSPTDTYMPRCALKAPGSGTKMAKMPRARTRSQSWVKHRLSSTPPLATTLPQGNELGGEGLRHAQRKGGCCQLAGQPGLQGEHLTSRG